MCLLRKYFLFSNLLFIFFAHFTTGCSFLWLIDIQDMDDIYFSSGHHHLCNLHYQEKIGQSLNFFNAIYSPYSLSYHLYPGV